MESDKVEEQLKTTNRLLIWLNMIILIVGMFIMGALVGLGTTIKDVNPFK